MTSTATKQCTLCLLVKDISEFTHDSYCKPCYAAYRREYNQRQKTSDKIKLCPKCKQKKPRSEFQLNGYCKPCAKILSARRRFKNKPIILREIFPEGKRRCGVCLCVFKIVRKKQTKCKPCENAYQRQRYQDAKKWDPNLIKVCSICKIEKKYSEFYNPTRSQCKLCFNARYSTRPKATLLPG